MTRKGLYGSKAARLDVKMAATGGAVVCRSKLGGVRLWVDCSQVRRLGDVGGLASSHSVPVLYVLREFQPAITPAESGA